MQQWRAAILMTLALPGIAKAHGTATIEADPAKMCTADGAFGERFGATEIQGRLVARSQFSIYFLPRTSYPPFGAAPEPLAAVVSERTHKIFRVTASAFYPNRSASFTAWQSMDKQIEAGGWVRLGASPDTMTFADAAKPKDGVQIELSLMGQRLYMECTDMTLLAEAGCHKSVGKGLHRSEAALAAAVGAGTTRGEIVVAASFRI